jgi:hypothetical protein
MKKRFYLTLLVMAVLLLALPGFTAKGIRRVTRHPRRSRDTERAPESGALSTGADLAQPTLRVNTLALSPLWGIVKNGKKFVPSVPRPS